MGTARDTVRKWVDEAAASGEADAYTAKRGEARYDCRWQIDMRLHGLVHKVITRDVSDNGVGLLSEQEVRAGEYIELRRDANEPWIEARVMHSTQTVGRWKVGTLIQLKEEEGEDDHRRGDESPQLAESLLALARMMIGRGNHTGAEAMVRECLEIRKKALPPEHWLIACAQAALGRCMVGRQRFEDAEELLAHAYRVISAAVGDDHERTTDARDAILELYEAWGTPEKAQAFLDEVNPEPTADETAQETPDA